LKIDKYGEQDLGFSRGKPLLFVEERYKQILKMFHQSHLLANTIVSNGNRSYHL